MKSSGVQILALALLSVSALGDKKKNVVIYPEATEVDTEKDIENKEIKDLKQKIADIVGEAFYNLTTAKEKRPGKY